MTGEFTSGASGWSTFSQATPNRMPTWSDSTGRYDTSGCHSTTGETWRRFKTLPLNGCGLTTMTDPTWPWAGSHQSSDWPWLHNVSTSQTPAKGDDYQRAKVRGSHKATNFSAPYYWADLYNGNTEITIDAGTVTISAPNFDPPQTYDLHFSYPIRPRSSGEANTSILRMPSSIKPDPVLKLSTCSK